MVIDGQLAGSFQIKTVDCIFQLAGSAGSSNGNGAVGCGSCFHALDNDPQELDRNVNGSGNHVRCIDVADIENVVSRIQSGHLRVLRPLCIIIRCRDIFSGDGQQCKLIASGYLSGFTGRFAVINAAGDLVKVNRDLAIAVGGVDRTSYFIRGDGLCYLGDGNSALRQNDGQRINY